MALTAEAELEIRRQVELEMTRYATEVQAYRGHLETVFRNILYGMGVLGALAAILFTYFFNKTSSDLAAQAKAQIDERVLDYKIKEDVRNRLTLMIEQEVIAPGVVEKVRRRIDELAKTAVATNATSTISNAIAKELPQLKNISPEQIREDLSRTLPVGSVTASILPPDDYYRLANREGTPATWQLADGSTATGTQYGKISGRATVPDLRGKFLRGLNVGLTGETADPDLNREVGSYEADALRSHEHTYSDAFTGGSGSGIQAGGSYPRNTSTRLTESFGGAETRPKNVAVYYYIKIN